MTTKHRIAKTLHQCGMPAGLSGYNILIDAIELVLNDPEYIKFGMVTRGLYPKLAKMFGTSAARIERNIRTAVEVGFNRSDTRELKKLFRNTIDREKGVPTNKEFIAMVAEYVRFSAEEEEDWE